MTTPPSPPSTTPLQQPSPFQSATHALALLLATTPLLLALPPRKLDLYTAALTGAFVVSANHLTHERTGTGILGNVGRRLRGDGDGGPGKGERAREGEKMREQGREPGRTAGFANTTTLGGAADGRLAIATATGKVETQEARGGQSGEKAEEGREGKGVAGLARALWMGQEGEGWKERRVREEREKLAEGRGYGGLIVDQIWEVWNGGGKKGEGGTGTEGEEGASDGDR